jgi:hypothetical protein
MSMTHTRGTIVHQAQSQPLGPPSRQEPTACWESARTASALQLFFLVVVRATRRVAASPRRRNPSLRELLSSRTPRAWMFQAPG